MHPTAFLLCTLIKSICREKFSTEKAAYSVKQKYSSFYVKRRLVNTCSPWMILPPIAQWSCIITMFSVWLRGIWVNHKTDIMIIYFVIIGRFNLLLAIFFIWILRKIHDCDNLKNNNYCFVTCCCKIWMEFCLCCINTF